jgi:tRNA (uracil-5-)-methyltransferase TRM9
MNEEIIRKLLDINGQFYQSFGPAFAETRRRIQPGVQKVLDGWITDGNWLDLGCGSGALSLRWVDSGKRGKYTGLDFSEPLLSEARKGIEKIDLPEGLQIDFVKKDLLSVDWNMEWSQGSFDGILAFASLHHLPGEKRRTAVIQKAAKMIKTDGFFIHSEWQFQNSPKLLARVQPWSMVGLNEKDVEPGDTLLDWRHQVPGGPEGSGLRYVHLFDREELGRLAAENGFEIADEFESDGKEGNLALYQVWKKF